MYAYGLGGVGVNPALRSDGSAETIVGKSKSTYSWGISVPLMFILILGLNPTSIDIPQIGLYLSMYVASSIFTSFTVLWLCCSPVRHACINGSKSELFYYLVPVQFECLVIDAQYHFWATSIFVFLLALMLIREYRKTMKQWKRREETFTDEQRVAGKKRAVNRFRRKAMRIAFYMTVIPCFFAIFVYSLSSPSFRAAEKKLNRLISQETETEAVQEDSADPYRDNLGLLLQFKEDNWKKLSLDEKISAVQLFCNFEADRLGIPQIQVTVKSLNHGSGTLGEYSDDDGTLCIDLQMVSDTEAEQTIEGVSHETYHAMQYFLIHNADWGSDASKTAYFQKARAWKNNTDNYKGAWSDGYDAYSSQPLEKDAFEYAKEETAKVLSYISDTQ